MKLHIGCGKKALEGWINIDIKDHPWIDLKHNILQPLPYDKNTIDYIFNEHVFEHFTQREGMKILRDWHRVLSLTGVIRIAMPGLKDSIAKYLDGSWRNEPWVKKLKFRRRTDAEYLNLLFYGTLDRYHHKCIYDFELLKRNLERAGFRNVQQQVHHQSSYIELCNIEGRSAAESNLIIEAVK